MVRHRNPQSHPLTEAFHAALHAGTNGFGVEQPAFEIQTTEDARAVVHILEAVAAFDEPQLIVWADSAVSLLNSPGPPRAVKVLLEEGVPNLLRMEEKLRHAAAEGEGNAWMRVLRALVTTCTPTGGERLLDAIRNRRHPEHPLWSFIFSDLRTGSVQREMVFAAFREVLPPPPFLPLLLSLGKAVCLEDDKVQHPLDQPVAREWFERWILEPETDASTAIDAAVSLAFLRQPWAANLSGCALRHPVRQVRVEAAWSLARAGDPRGLELLAEECLDFRIGGRARAYLEELGRADLVPAACRAPEFVLKTNLSRWVENPDGGFHRAPEEIETIYRTEARWPGLDQPTTLYMMRYRVQDKWGVRPDGIGFGGGAASAPECSWGTELRGAGHVTPEDMAAGCVYGLLKGTCFQELYGEDTRDYDFLIQHWQGDPLENWEMQRVVKFDPPLPGLPAWIAVVEAELDSQKGWVVLESSRGSPGESFWYDATLRPAGASSDDILQEHAGRRLLGWPLRPTESNVVHVALPPQIPAERFVASFERMVAAAVTGGSEVRYELMGRYGGWKIPKALDRYVCCLTELGRRQDLPEAMQRLTPMIDDGETAARVALHLASFGHQAQALELLTPVISGKLTDAGEALLARALHAAGHADAADILREPMHKLAGEFTAESKTWARWRVLYYQEQYGELIAALEECVGASLPARLEDWHLPETLVRAEEGALPSFRLAR